MGDIPKVAINGFGRIGRLALRCLFGLRDRVDIVAINDLSDREHMAHLFAFDSTHGRWGGTVENAGDDLVVNGDRFRILAEKDPAKLPWRDLGVDYVLESTGRFRARKDLKKHLDAGARRVILSAPGDEVDVTIARGVNDHVYDPASHRIVSNASCTTNCLGAVLKVLDASFGVKSAMMTTVHSYTNDQQLLDSHHNDLRRARSAAVSMIPTSTGAARAIGEVLPALAGKVEGMAIRVPTVNVSLVDLTARLAKDTDEKALARAFDAAAAGPLRGILRTETRPLVSVDFNHDPHSAVIDVPSLLVADRSLAKVIAWYDNEWAYAMRTAELIQAMWHAEP